MNVFCTMLLLLFVTDSVNFPSLFPYFEPTTTVWKLYFTYFCMLLMVSYEQWSWMHGSLMGYSFFLPLILFFRIGSVVCYLNPLPTKANCFRKQESANIILELTPIILFALIIILNYVHYSAHMGGEHCPCGLA